MGVDPEHQIIDLIGEKMVRAADDVVVDDDAFLQHIANLKTMRDTYGDLHEVEAVKAAKRFGAVLASHDDTTEDQVAVSAGHGIRLAEFPTTVEAARLLEQCLAGLRPPPLVQASVPPPRAKVVKI